ncbi:MAG: hypothetical protein SFY56_13810 [Bacteroidota bacterium]|nr:hypothetical protein [Bacteroidota bacterium]
MIKKISIRILGLLLVIVVLNYLYTYTLFKKDLKDKCPQALEIIQTQNSTDIYYFGESSNNTTLSTDSIKNSISEITNFFFPNLKITTIDTPAVHAFIYKRWLSQINTSKKLPKAIIVTLNLRSFNSTWINSSLETPLQESMVLLRPYPNIINRFALSLQVFDNKTEQEREKIMLTDWDTSKLIFPFNFKYRTVRQWDYSTNFESFYKKADGNKDEEKTILACHYIKAYAFNLGDNNPRIKDFDEINNWCSKNKIKLYLNLLAENVGYADSLVGRELVYLIKQNRDYLFKRYSKDNCTVIDNLELVNGKEFIDQNWTTEHYSYKGRMIIAKNLAQGLKTQFGSYYKEAY